MGIVQRVMAWGIRRLGGRTSTRVTAVLAAVYGLDSADKGAVGAMALHLQTGLEIGKTELGLLLTVSALAGAVGTIPFGWLVDRTSRTRVLAFAVLLWALAMFACTAATSYTHLLLARLGLGVVMAAAVPAVASLTGDYYQPHLRARMYGYILAGEFVGTGFGFIVAGALTLLSWRAGFLVLALAAPLVAWLVYRLPEPARGGADRFPPGEERRRKLPEDTRLADPDAVGVAEDTGNVIRNMVRAAGIAPRERLVFDESPGRKSLLWATWYVLHIPTNLILILASALGYYFFAGARTFGVEFLQGWFGVSHSGAIAVAVTFGIGALAGVLAGGRFADRLLTRGHLSARVLVAIFAYFAAGLFLIPALRSHSLLVAVPSLTLAAFFFGAVNPPVDAARLDIMHPYLWGRAEAIRTVLRLVAEAVAPVLFGYIAEHVFHGGPLALDYTLLVMLIPLFVSAAIGLVAFRTYPRDVATAEAYTRRTEQQNASLPAGTPAP